MNYYYVLLIAGGVNMILAITQLLSIRNNTPDVRYSREQMERMVKVALLNKCDLTGTIDLSGLTGPKEITTP